MMTMLAATLGLLPAAMSHDIGSDSQRPFADDDAQGLPTLRETPCRAMPEWWLQLSPDNRVT
jgi:hypothetical protein